MYQFILVISGKVLCEREGLPSLWDFLSDHVSGDNPFLFHCFFSCNERERGVCFYYEVRVSLMCTVSGTNIKNVRQVHNGDYSL